MIPLTSHPNPNYSNLLPATEKAPQWENTCKVPEIMLGTQLVLTNISHYYFHVNYCFLPLFCYSW